MRLKEIVAGHLYLEDTDHKPVVPFQEQDSNVRDFYHKEASHILYRLISSYLTSRGNIHRVVNGAVKSFLDAHQQLTAENRGSLTKRIIMAIKNNVKEVSDESK